MTLVKTHKKGLLLTAIKFKKGNSTKLQISCLEELRSLKMNLTGQVKYRNKDWRKATSEKRKKMTTL